MEAILSRDRIEGFRDAATQSTDELAGRYLLNAALTEALHPHLHALEVVLRNRLNEAIAAKYPIERDLPDTYHEYPTWLDAVDGPLSDDHRPKVDDAKRKLATELRRRWGARGGSAARLRTPGRLVAALPFSFWVYLFDSEYSGNRSQPGPLWPSLHRDVFPFHHINLSEVRKDLRRLLAVRNRCMHYERIYPYSDGKGISWKPDEIRDSIERLVSAMSPRTATLLRRVDRIPEVMYPAAQRYLRLLPLQV